MAQKKTFKAGEIIFKEGEKQNWMYVILWGQVDLYADYDGDKKFLTSLGAEDFFGEMGMIEGEPRSATAVVKEDATLILIDEDNFADYFKDYPMKAHMILQNVSRRIRALSEDYLEACRALVAYQAADEAGAEQDPAVLATMKKIANVSKGN